MLLAGPTESGKSTFVKALLAHKDLLFETVPKKVYWFYGQHTDDLLSLPPEYVINEGLPENFNSIEPYSLVILDDLM